MPEQTDIEPDAVEAVAKSGWHLMSAATMARHTATTADDWARFRSNWDELTLDRYMRDGGTYRQRRFGQFRLDTEAGTLTPLPLRSYHQDESVNPLNGGIERHFDPLTERFAGDPVLRPLLFTLGRLFSAVEGISEWGVDLHPFRIVTSSAQLGKPAPQGRHRDGVTFVTTVLLGRTNVIGGESSLYTDAGEPVTATTLREPGEALILDDRRLMHDVTALRADDETQPAHRDVFIIDFNR